MVGDSHYTCRLSERRGAQFASSRRRRCNKRWSILLPDRYYVVQSIHHSGMLWKGWLLAVTSFRSSVAVMIMTSISWLSPFNRTTSCAQHTPATPPPIIMNFSVVEMLLALHFALLTFKALRGRALIRADRPISLLQSAMVGEHEHWNVWSRMGSAILCSLKFDGVMCTSRMSNCDHTPTFHSTFAITASQQPCLSPVLLAVNNMWAQKR